MRSLSPLPRILNIFPSLASTEAGRRTASLMCALEEYTGSNSAAPRGPRPPLKAKAAVGCDRVDGIEESVSIVLGSFCHGVLLV